MICGHCIEERELTHELKNDLGVPVKVCTQCFDHYQRKKDWRPFYWPGIGCGSRRPGITLANYDRFMTQFERYRWAAFYKRVLLG